MQFSSEKDTGMKELHTDALKTNAPWKSEQCARWCITFVRKANQQKNHGMFKALVRMGLKTWLHHILKSLKNGPKGFCAYWHSCFFRSEGKKVFLQLTPPQLSVLRLFCLTCASIIGYTHQFLTFASALKYLQFQIYLSQHTGLNALCHRSDRIGPLPSMQQHSREKHRPVATGWLTIPLAIYKLEEHTTYSSVSLLTPQHMLRWNVVKI